MNKKLWVVFLLMATWSGRCVLAADPAPLPAGTQVIVPDGAASKILAQSMLPGGEGLASADAHDQGDSDGIHFNGGASLIFFIPRFESNPAFTATTIHLASPGGINATTRRIQEFSYDFAASPRVWIGVELEDGLGARVRWWNFNESAKTLQEANPPIPLGSPTTVSLISSMSPLLAIMTPSSFPAVTSVQTQGIPARPDFLQFTNDLSLNVCDFEATFSDLHVGRWSFLASGGVRYAHVIQRYSAQAVGNVPQVQVSGESFDGLGPLLGVEARRTLGIAGLSGYGAMRFAALYGSDKRVSYGLNLGLLPPLALTATDDASSRQRFLPVFDLELGVEWSHDLGPAKLLVQLAMLAEAWPTGSGSSGNGNMGLFGIAASTGFNY